MFNPTQMLSSKLSTLCEKVKIQIIINIEISGDACTIFTPDDTHYTIAKEAIERGVHVLLTKPPVKTLQHQLDLVSLAKQRFDSHFFLNSRFFLITFQ
jgi:hypothetical protein